MNMAGRNDVLAKCKLRSVIRFRHAEGWCMGNEQCNCGQTLRRLRRTILTSVIVLIQDKACSHSAVVTQQHLDQLKWEVFDHSACSPDLATSDFHLFPEMKNRLGGQRFQKNEGIQSKTKDPSHITGGKVLRRGDRKPGLLA
ncbi:hypothetical protein AVEN_108069-1 [Araneus ventricosus]|uniref:Uncharacterized protein n=1 Tax=Araneus ventricosus TaxID=182803 RepID=A0A4Y2K8H5_ARAVE|nr:hypothetical protein AVEN_108069-1 [Araneus ventricosus]